MSLRERLRSAFGPGSIPTTSRPESRPGSNVSADAWATPSAPLPTEFPPGWAVIDVETTGLSAKQDRIIELTILRTDAQLQVVDQWVARFHPDRAVMATHIHGITDADLLHAPRFSALVAHINARLAGAAVIAHNARFDLAFLRTEYGRAGWQLPYVPALCTYELASTRHLPHLPRHRLGDCCAAVGINLVAPHSSVHDAYAAHGLARHFLRPGQDLSPQPSELRLPEEASRISWPSAPHSAPVVAKAVPEPRSRELSDQAYRTMAKRAAERTAPALRALLDQVRLADALDDGAPDGSLPYLALLAEALEDGVLTSAEQEALRDLATAYDLDEDHIGDAHRGFVLALAHLALDDGKVTRQEKDELAFVSDLLSVDKKVLDKQVKAAEAAREARLSAGLLPLPTNWPHGEPLRVGDRVAFTGCDPDDRELLEVKAERLGVRVMSNVSGRTALLVTDGSFSGAKVEDAQTLGTRLVEPAIFAVLLEHLQPALPRAARSRAQCANPTTQILSAPSEDLAGQPSADPATVRAWARAHGLPVGERGRIDGAVWAAYRDAVAASAVPVAEAPSPAARAACPNSASSESATGDAAGPGSPAPAVPDRQPMPPANWYPDPGGRYEHRF